MCYASARMGLCRVCVCVGQGIDGSACLLLFYVYTCEDASLCELIRVYVYTYAHLYMSLCVSMCVC